MSHRMSSKRFELPALILLSVAYTWPYQPSALASIRSNKMIANLSQVQMVKQIAGTSALPTSLIPQQITFVTRSVGYLSGVITTRGISTSQLYKTDTGGKTWLKVFHGGDQITSLFANKKNVWIDVSKTTSYPSKSELYFSTNAGASFHSVNSPTLTSMSFTHNLIGFATTSGLSPAISQSAILVHTADGGKTWTKAANAPKIIPNEPTLGAQVIRFADTKTGFLLETGEPGTGYQQKELFITKNGGKTWTKILPTSTTSFSNNPFFAGAGYASGLTVVPKNPTSIWIWQAYGPLLHSKDRGRKWTNVKIKNPFTYQVLSVSFVHHLLGYALLQHNVQGGHSSLLMTTNGGKNWTVVDKW